MNLLDITIKYSSGNSWKDEATADILEAGIKIVVAVAIIVGAFILIGLLYGIISVALNKNKKQKDNISVKVRIIEKIPSSGEGHFNYCIFETTDNKKIKLIILDTKTLDSLIVGSEGTLTYHHSAFVNFDPSI